MHEMKIFRENPELIFEDLKKRKMSNNIAKNVIDPNDNSMFPKPKREWVEARADAYTSMLAAFTKTTAIVEKWVPDHQTSFPPVIINMFKRDIFSQT